MRVTVKLATTLDGRIATRTGESQWITGPAARRAVHELRAEHQAVLTGVNTVLADNPRLDAREVDLPLGKQPDRIILDTNLRTPEAALILREGGERVFILHGKDAPTKPFPPHVELLPCETDANGWVELTDALRQLSETFEINTLFVEAGGQVAASFLRANCVDRLEWFRAPMIIGGDGLPALGGLNVVKLQDALRFRLVKLRSIEHDVWETYEKEDV